VRRERGEREQRWGWLANTLVKGREEVPRVVQTLQNARGGSPASEAPSQPRAPFFISNLGLKDLRRQFDPLIQPPSEVHAAIINYIFKTNLLSEIQVEKCQHRLCQMFEYPRTRTRFRLILQESRTGISLLPSPQQQLVIPSKITVNLYS
jgi:hypothetical protein